MTDVYQFEKAQLPQGIDETTPFLDKDWTYINDTNQSSYTNNGLTPVAFDLSSIYSSETFQSTSEAYVVVPVTIVGAYAAIAGGLTAPGANDWARLSMKCGTHQLLHQADITIDGKSWEQTTPYLNQYVSCKLLSQMSQDDLNSFGPSMGFGSSVDSSLTLRQNVTPVTVGGTPAVGVAGSTAVGSVGGNGIVNANGFGPIIQAAAGVELNGLANPAFYSRTIKPVDMTTASSGFYGATSYMTAGNLNNEFRATYQVLNTNYMVIYDYAIIKLSNIFDCLASLPLCKRLNAQIRLYFNTGALGVQCNTQSQSFIFSNDKSTFTNTCPLMINTSFNTPTLAGNAASCLVAGLFISRPPTTNIFNVNLALSGAAHPLTSVRLYYPQVKIKENRIEQYISLNRNKTIKWTSFYFSQYSGIGVGSSWSQLVQSGVVNPRGIWIVPMVSATVNGLQTGLTGIQTFPQYASPFDSAPITNAPLSLTNLQVMIGNKNMLNNPIQYSYSHFLDNVSLYEKINAGDLGLSCGLMSQLEFEYGKRFYYVDCSRGNLSDMLSPRNVVISFNNNSNTVIDVQIFIEFYREAQIDVLTSEVKM